MNAPRIQGNRECDHCGENFTPTKYWQRFCCPEHQRKWNSERRKKAFQALEEKENTTNDVLDTAGEGES